MCFDHLHVLHETYAKHSLSTEECWPLNIVVACTLQPSVVTSCYVYESVFFLIIYFMLFYFISRELSRFIAAGRLNCKIDKVGGVVETNR